MNRYEVLNRFLLNHAVGWFKAALDIRTLVVGIAIVICLAACLGFAFDTNTNIPEIRSRTQVGLLDIVLALASGCAGVFAFTTGASSAVIGVMVAVALLNKLLQTDFRSCLREGIALR
jgi:uncharacterized membrane protein